MCAKISPRRFEIVIKRLRHEKEYLMVHSGSVIMISVLLDLATRFQLMNLYGGSGTEL
jgi:hypothetical protein